MTPVPSASGDALAPETAYFSILRWVENPVREEAKNLAVILIDAEGRSGAMRAVDLEKVLRRKRPVKLLEAYLEGLATKVTGDQVLTLKDVRELSASMNRSLQLTEPKKTAIKGDLSSTAEILYRAYVEPKPARGPQGPSKKRLMRRVEAALRSTALGFQRDAKVEDYKFDFLISPETSAKVAMGVFEFKATLTDWKPVEQEGAYFLRAVTRTRANGAALVSGPLPEAEEEVVEAHQHVTKWCSEEGVPVIPAERFLESPRERLATVWR